MSVHTCRSFVCISRSKFMFDIMFPFILRCVRMLVFALCLQFYVHACLSFLKIICVFRLLLLLQYNFMIMWCDVAFYYVMLNHDVFYYTMSYGVSLRCIMLRFARSRCATRCYAMAYRVMCCWVMLCNVIQCHAMLCIPAFIILCCAVLCCAMLCSVA